MKILHVLQSMDPKLGGVVRAVETMVKGLNELSHNNQIVSLDTNTEDISGENYIHCLGDREHPWGYSRLLLPWLNNNLINYDVIIVHGLWQYYGWAVYKSISHLKKNHSISESDLPKIYVMPHGMLDPYFQNAPNRKLKALRNWLYWKVFENKLINSAFGIIFTCETESILAETTFSPYFPNRKVIASLGVEKPPVYNSSMTTYFRESCYQIADGSSYILFLSRIQEKKGVDLIIDAYSNILANQEQKTLPKLVIAGPGLDSEYGKLVQSIVAKSPILKEHILFVGMLSGDKKWGAFYNCEAFILPSHQENFGIAVVEALACGKPVLISNQVNIWREIENHGAGIVENNTLLGSERLITKWLSTSSADRIKMGSNATECYEKLYTVRSAASNLARSII